MYLYYFELFQFQFDYFVTFCIVYLVIYLFIVIHFFLNGPFGKMQRNDMVNTAILTSRQVSEPLRVFVVTQAGKVADVTLQASCSSADESVLKVHLHISSRQKKLSIYGVRFMFLFFFWGQKSCELWWNSKFIQISTLTLYLIDF